MSSHPSAAAAGESSSSKVSVGARCTIAQDTDIRGRVHFGDGTVVHPKAMIHAPTDDGGASCIEIGADCIIEETVHIVHRGPGTMKIGNRNLFEVGCSMYEGTTIQVKPRSSPFFRVHTGVESPSIGSHNTFECKSRTTDAVVIQDFTTVGTGCIAQPPAQWEATTAKDDDGDSPSPRHRQLYTFPSRTVIYGQESRTRLWSGNGVRQADALHAKHLDHLRRNIPEFHTLRIIK